MSIPKTDGSRMLLMSSDGKYELRIYGSSGVTKTLKVIDITGGEKTLWEQNIADNAITTGSNDLYLQLDSSNRLKLCSTVSCSGTPTDVTPTTPSGWPAATTNIHELRFGANGILELKNTTNTTTPVWSSTGRTYGPAAASGPVAVAGVGPNVIQLATDLQKVEDTILNKDMLTYTVLGGILVITFIMFMILMFTTLKKERMGVICLLVINAIALTICIMMLVVRGMVKSRSGNAYMPTNQINCSIDEIYDPAQTTKCQTRSWSTQ